MEEQLEESQTGKQWAEELEEDLGKVGDDVEDGLRNVNARGGRRLCGERKEIIDQALGQNQTVREKLDSADAR